MSKTTAAAVSRILSKNGEGADQVTTPTYTVNNSGHVHLDGEYVGKVEKAEREVKTGKRRFSVERGWQAIALDGRRSIQLYPTRDAAARSLLAGAPSLAGLHRRDPRMRAVRQMMAGVPR